MNEYQKYLIEEFVDEYHERRMSRRSLLRRAVLIMGSVPAAAAALVAAGCGDDDDPPLADDESPTAPPGQSTAATATAATTATRTAPSAAASAAATTAAEGAEIKFKGPGSDLLGYLALPTGEAKAPGVLIIHENRGLNDHTRDIARRYAAEGFAALAVDLVSRDGGSKADTAATMYSSLFGG